MTGLRFAIKLPGQASQVLKEIAGRILRPEQKLRDLKTILLTGVILRRGLELRNPKTTLLTEAVQEVVLASKGKQAQVLKTGASEIPEAIAGNLPPFSKAPVVKPSHITEAIEVAAAIEAALFLLPKDQNPLIRVRAVVHLKNRVIAHPLDPDLV